MLVLSHTQSDSCPAIRQGRFRRGDLELSQTKKVGNVEYHKEVGFLIESWLEA